MGENYNIDYSINFPLSDVIKAYGVKISEYNDSLLDRMLQYARLSKRVNGTKLLCVIDPVAYLSKGELAEFYRIMSNEELSTLTICPRKYENSYDYDSITIIDTDNCVIYC